MTDTGGARNPVLRRPASTGQEMPRGRSRLLASLAGVVALLALWELLSRTDILPSQYFPPASVVLATLAGLVGNAVFWNVIGLTLGSWALGLGIAVLLGVPLGVVFGASDPAYRFCRVVIEALRPIPPVVLIPISLLIFGASLPMKLVLIVYGALWPLLMQTMYGVRGVDPLALETARSYRLRAGQRFLFVRMAGAAPLIGTGLRLSAIIALVVTIVAELVGGAPGLGNDILVAQASNAPELMYALILVTGALGVLVNAVFRRLERAALFWHPSQRTAE